MPDLIRITLDPKNCIGCNTCVSFARECWKLDFSEQKVDLIGSDGDKAFQSITIDQSLEEKNRLAARCCPVNVITVLPEK